MHIVILVTCRDKKQADDIASSLIKNKLAACVNIVDRIESLFYWQGKLDRAKEALLIIKSKKAKLAKIIRQVKLKHNYEVPEIIALPVVGGYRDYLRWIDESLGK